MTSPVVTHPVCELDLRRRLSEARTEAVARAVGRRRRRTLLDRLLGRASTPREILAEDLHPCSTDEDVWAALRF